MVKGLISIFAMPHEIEDLQLTLYNLKRNMAVVPSDIEMDIDLTFCMSNELTDWDRTADGLYTSQEYIMEKFMALTSLLDWSKNPLITIEKTNQILGCVSQRRSTLKNSDGYDFTIWLDCDMFFSDYTIMYLAASYQALKANGHKNIIVTPQYVRQWDETWDMLVHPHFKKYPLMYHESADIITDVLQTDSAEVDLVAVNGFKIAGGWCTLISNDLLNLVGIPDSLGHYGLEDTFITAACDLMVKNNYKDTPVQYRLDNHIVGENYINRRHNYTGIVRKDRKEEFRAIATSNFSKELELFRQRVLG